MCKLELYKTLLPKSCPKAASGPIMKMEAKQDGQDTGYRRRH